MSHIVTAEAARVKAQIDNCLVLLGDLGEEKASMKAKVELKYRDFQAEIDKAIQRMITHYKEDNKKPPANEIQGIRKAEANFHDCTKELRVQYCLIERFENSIYGALHKASGVVAEIEHIVQKFHCDNGLLT